MRPTCTPHVRSNWMVFGIACLMLYGMAAGAGNIAGAADLRIGAAAVVITPPLGTPMAGYYHARGADGVLDDLYARAMVVECGGSKAALVTCDLIAIGRHTVLAARRRIEAACGIPGSHVMISVTHSHTGPVIDRESDRDLQPSGADDRSATYTTGLPEAIAKAVVAANAKLQPASLLATKAVEDRISFNRRFWMKDGTVSWNPPKGDPRIIRPAGPIDPEVEILYAAGMNDVPLATYVNFAMHPDTTGGTRISADYPGVLSRRLADVKGDAMVTLFANGCCGNINHLDNRWIAPQSSPAEAKRLGTALAGTVLAALPKLKPVAPAAIRAQSRVVPLPLAPITEDEVKAARRTVDSIPAGKATFMEQVKAFQVLDVASRKGKPLEAEVQVIALGDQLAWVSLSGEVFVELGLSIKRASPFTHTMIAELANGVVGYVPNKSAYPEGNYEVVSARCAAGSGEMLVSAAIEMLESLAAAQRGGKTTAK